MSARDEAWALLRALGPQRVERFLDVGAGAADLACLLHDRDGCEIACLDIGPGGRIGGLDPARLEGWRRVLARHGIPDSRIRILRRAEDLRPADLIANLDGFGVRWKVPRLGPVLDACLHADARLVSDIRRGSGAFPFLRARGACTAPDLPAPEGITRVIFTPAPPVPDTNPEWSRIARDLAGRDGFFTDNGRHSFLFVPRGDTLVVTFDNLDITMGKRADRRPWGHDFIEKQGWSMLGAMAGGWTWYRDPWVAAEFDRLAASGFFARFARVVFYGASMGGYAAAAFSAACPGADVLVISPQSTVDKRVVPWESRYKVVWDKDFTGKYGDAAQVSRTARRVTILFDPYEPLDAAHVARFTAPNVVKLRCPLMGHRLGSSLSQMGLLNPVILGALNGTLEPADFYRMLRARRDFPRYQKELFARARARGHPDLARRLGAYVLARGEHPAIRAGLAEMDAAAAGR